MAIDEGSGSKPSVYCTLVTNDAYVIAALVLAKSLRNTKTTHQLTVIVTPDDMSSDSMTRLADAFDAVIPVAAISGISQKNLTMIGRPDLHATLTKLQLWSLTHYSRVLYLDADTLVLQNLDHLFDSLPTSIDFAAAPELGYPDCFNAGLMFLTPDRATHEELLAFAASHESYDGGDQGLLNVFFGDGTRGHPLKEVLSSSSSDNATNEATNGSTRKNGKSSSSRNWFRLSFTYNMEMHKVFRLNIPAALRYRDEHKVLHFIGKDKPWHFPDGKVDVPEDASPYFRFYAEMVGKWWEVRRSLGGS